MEKEFKKKIQVKNFSDIMSENLRRLDAQTNNNSIINEKFYEYTKNFASIKPNQNNQRFERTPILSQEANVNIYQTPKDIETGNKILKSTRRILHREIRDWIAEPIQLQQNKFNQKVLRNIDEIYSELDFQYKEKKENSEIQSIITMSFLEVLERIPSKKELGNYVKLFKSGGLELTNFQNNLKNSEEYSDLQEKKIIFEKYRNEIKKPIFIIGVPRSGTGLVHGILCAHPDLAWLSEKDVGNWLSSLEQYQIHNYYEWLKSTKKKIPTSDEALFILGKNIGKGLQNFATPPIGIEEIPIEGEHFWRKYLGRDYVEDVSLDSKIYIAKGILEIIKRKEKLRFVNKAPQNSMRLFAIQKIFPDAKFINVIRDPRPVIASMMKRFEDEGEFTMGFPVKDQIKFEELSWIEKWASKYKQVTEYIYQFYKHQNKDNFLTVEYDELIRDPNSVTKKIFEFCELPVPKSLQNIIPPIRKNTSEKWHEKLTKKDEQRIFDIVNPIIEKMGYSYKL